MSRHPRLVLPEVPLHIIQRGNNRNACFFRRSDYQVYLALLADATLKFDCPVHAYVLMTNHVHLLTTPSTGKAAAAMMKQVGQSYVQYINRHYERFGTLWQGRFRSCLVQEERYFMACQRYIELNPVRAGIVTEPWQYEWSSYRFNAEGAMNSIITPHHTYLSIGQSTQERHARYQALFAEVLSQGMIDELRQATNGNRAIGSATFVERIGTKVGREIRPQRAGRRPFDY